ncbi:efflux RND transporter permease subunit [Pontibacter sp. G13]|uniref:efflux RND transporter permease subunit n=1 Tax=Pontibacter sp. G13 TaxID=3074898 RepID=UPI00288AECC9|nr:efflux RND transporter permease subunit [Pontibacter sp. G13]WNJ17520.1 efflux RND transporter permease subunit [Pontibacter sp. G13]
MLNRILTFSLNFRWLVIVIAVGLSIFGIWRAQSIPVDVFPDLSAPTVTILTEAHGLESQEVEKLVSYPLETAMNGAPNVRRIRSSSAAGISIVWVEFEWGMDIYRARQMVAERIPLVQASLPKEVGNPTMAPISSIMGEIMLLAVRSDSLDPMEVRSFTDWNIAPQLKSVQGIANVMVLGGAYKQYQVLAQPEKLAHYGIGAEELLAAVQDANLSVPGGYLNQHGNQYVVQGYGRAYAMEDLGQSVIRSVNGQPIRVGDIAKVQIGAADKIGEGSMNAAPAVILVLSKQPNVNTLELTQKLDETLAGMKQTLPVGMELETQVFRQADFIQASVDNLQTTLWEGALFVILILAIFLMDVRTTLISVLAIPISLIVTLIVLDLLGFSLNTMSLGGMAIAIGALVDDAIIDVENVYKRLRENRKLAEAERKPMLQVVKDASLEIRGSILMATMIIIVAFVPLFFLSGMEGRLLRPMGLAFIVSVVTSLLVSITLTPVLCAYLLANDRTLGRSTEGTRLERFLRNRYKQFLGRILTYRKGIVFAVIGIFLLSLGLATQLGRGFLPEFNEGSLVISVVGPAGMSLGESNRVGNHVERLLLELPEVDVVTRRTGRAELDEHAQGVNAAEIDVPFTLQHKSKEAFFEEVRNKLAIVPGVNISLGQPIAHRIDHMLSGTRANIAIKIFGDDLTQLFRIGQQVQAVIQSVDGIADVNLDQQIEVPQLRIAPNRGMLAAHGMTVGQLMRQVDIACAGETAGEIHEGQRYFDLIVRYVPEARSGIEQIRRLPIQLPQGGFVPLLELAEVQSISSPDRITREQVQRVMVVAANVQGRDLRGVVTDIQASIGAQVPLPTGYRIAYGGQFEREAEASRLLMWAAIGAIAVMFLLLFVEFRSVPLAGVVLINLPLALIGGIITVFFTSGWVSIAATIGFISLFGIAARNGILMVSRYEDLKSSGIRGRELLIRGAVDRLNPILMTALTTGLALIPLALKGGAPGNEIQSPMAVVMLGGLLSATLLNLVVIPCVYAWMEENA